jgi:serine O-acetyltransferase
MPPENPQPSVAAERGSVRQTVHEARAPNEALDDVTEPPSQARAALRALRADRARYPPGAWATARPLWGIAYFRAGQAISGGRGLHWRILRRLHTHLRPFAEALSGVEIGVGAEIGPGFCVGHGAGVVIHGRSRIGSQCTMAHGVTLGVRTQTKDPLPVIGDHVGIGAYAQILGGVHVGDGAHIGALALVIRDVPARHTARGIPAESFPQSDS